MSNLAVSTDRISITFGDRPFHISEIRNLLTGGKVLVDGAQSLLVRAPGRISDPTFLTDLVSVAATGGGYRFAIADSEGKWMAGVEIRGSADGLRMSLHVEGPTPLWVAEWKLTGLRLGPIIIPALGGQSLGTSMPPDITLTYKYPFWWNAQFVLGAMKGGGFWLRTKDVDPLFKFLRVRKEDDGFALSLGFEATAPLASRSLDASWHLDAYRGDWKVPVEMHRQWMEKSFGLRTVGENPFMPEWAREIDFVLELWGAGKDRPEPLHTFDDMQDRLKAWSRLHDPARTLVYLPGFAEHGIDSHAPSYRPSPLLGGEQKFRELMATAHAMGYRVMIHTNALCMTFDHPLFAKMQKYQVVDQFHEPRGWGLDLDGDWLAEPYFAYMNPGEERWQKLLAGVIGDLIARFGPDAVFLDQTLLAFNVSRGPNFVTGMRQLVRRLQEAFPAVLFAGEGLHEMIVSALPMAQIHGLDSLAEVHGIEGKVPWRAAHPVSTYLFGKYTRYMAHLLTRHPSHPLFRKQEEAYARLGVIPALCLYNRKQALDTPGTRSMIRRARALTKWTSAWNQSERRSSVPGSSVRRTSRPCAERPE